MTVEEMLRRMSAREFLEWQVFHSKIEAIGDLRGDVQTGIIAATVANSQRSKGRRAKPTDFLPYKDQEQQTPEEQVQRLKSANPGGRPRRGNPSGPNRPFTDGR